MSSFFIIFCDAFHGISKKSIHKFGPQANDKSPNDYGRYFYNNLVKKTKKILMKSYKTRHKISKMVLTTAGLRHIPHLSIADSHNIIKLKQIT